MSRIVSEKAPISNDRVNNIRNKEQDQHYPPLYYKAKQSVVEELAIQRVVEEIREESGTEPMPESWMIEADTVYNSLRSMLRNQVEIERSI